MKDMIKCFGGCEDSLRDVRVCVDGCDGKKVKGMCWKRRNRNFAFQFVLGRRKVMNARFVFYKFFGRKFMLCEGLFHTFFVEKTVARILKQKKLNS